MEEVSNGVYEAGGKPGVFAVSDICDGVVQATDGMSYSLVSRDIMAAMVGLAERMEAKNAKVMWPVRIAAAGKAVTPGGAVEICRILGKDETLRRIHVALEKLA